MDGYVQTNVRIPRSIMNWLKDEAKRNRRSYSAEVTYQLEQARRSQLRRERSHKEETSGSWAPKGFERPPK